MAALARAGEKHFLALERQRAELMGSQEEAVAARAASERDGRVEMIRKQAARRLQRQGLLRGWEAWQAAAQEATRQKRRMQGGWRCAAGEADAARGDHGAQGQLAERAAARLVALGTRRAAGDATGGGQGGRHRLDALRQRP